MSSSRTVVRLRRHNLVLVLIGAVVVGVLVVVVANVVATEKVRRVHRGWDETLGTWDEIMARFPRSEANAKALRLETLSAALGIDLVPRAVDGRPRPDERAQAEHKRVGPDVGRYLDAQLERGDAGIEAPPDVVQAFLAAGEDELAALHRELESDEIPQWEMQLDALGSAPIPNLIGHVFLHKLLLADALASTQRGAHARARAGLEASWRLNAGIRDDPILIDQLIALSVARLQAGTVRHLVDIPGEWRARLSEHDYRESLLTALKYEGWVWSRLGAPPAHQSAPERPNPLKRAAMAVVDPYVRFCMADVSDHWRRRLVSLAAVERICDDDLASRSASLDVPIAQWNLVGALAVPNLAGALDRLARLEIELELTSKLFEIEAARMGNAGVWPRSIPGIENSSVCAGDRWEYRLDVDGSASIAFGREPAWVGKVGPEIPLRHSLTR